MKRLAAILTLVFFWASLCGESQTMVTGFHRTRLVLQGNISRHGSCVGVSSCEMSVSAGDLKIMWAVEDGSVFAPTLPAGFVNIATGSVGTVTNSIAYRLYCSRASDSLDQSTGTATSATYIVGLSYTGVNGTLTANCATSGDATGGRFGTTGTLATQTYGPVSMVVSTGRSWILGFAGNHTSTNCTPVGLYAVQSTGTGPSILANDSFDGSRGGMTTGGRLQCAVATSNEVAYMIEILSS